MLSGTIVLPEYGKRSQLDSFIFVNTIDLQKRKHLPIQEHLPQRYRRSSRRVPVDSLRQHVFALVGDRGTTISTYDAVDDDFILCMCLKLDGGVFLEY